MLAIANKWQPYRTIATMLLWHFYLASPKNRGLRWFKLLHFGEIEYVAGISYDNRVSRVVKSSHKIVQ